MPRIISVIPLLLWFGLSLGPARAEDAPAADGDEAAAPAAVPDTAAEPAAPTPAPAPAARAEQGDSLGLQPDVPVRYTVQKGDTLWGISGRFLKDPWKWPDLWGVNKDLVKNPHLIYPGDVLVLDLTGATPRLRLDGAPDGGLSRWYGYELQTTQLTPQMRSEPLAALAIPAIPAKVIDPFLMRPLIVNPSQVARAPKIVAANDKRVVVSTGDVAYVTGLDPSKGNRWQVYRQGRVFQDPDTRDILGYEAVYLGDADITGTGDISTILIGKSLQEIGIGDRLTIAPPLQSSSYMPRAPDVKVSGKIIAGADNTVYEMGTYSVVILNRGARDGLEVGHVLGLYRSEGAIPVTTTKLIPLPEQRYGVAMVFRVFERMSYGLIMASSRPANVNDSFRNP